MIPSKPRDRAQRAVNLTSIKFSDIDLKMLNELKRIYGFKSNSQAIKHLILWHYQFWNDRGL